MAQNQRKYNPVGCFFVFWEDCLVSERAFMPDRTYFLTPELMEPGERRATFLVSKQMFIPDVTPFFLSKHYILTRTK